MNQQAETVSPPTVAEPRPLTYWPAILLFAALLGTKFAPAFVGETSFLLFMLSVWGPTVCALLLVLWWAFLSGASRSERLWGTLALIAFFLVSAFSVDKSVQGFGYLVYVLPWAAISGTVGIFLAALLLPSQRTSIGLVVAALAFGYWELVRSDGVTGEFQSEMQWRWTATKENKLTTKQPTSSLPTENTAAVSSTQLAAFQHPEWAEFRGPQRAGLVPKTKLATDWEAQPPKLIWKQELGPGWSSFVCAGEMLITQEQREDVELVTCYATSTGKMIWSNSTKARFWESVAGAGPRATPTLHDGALYTLGATGILQRLDPATGKAVWTTDIQQDSKRTAAPIWGYCSSPLVIDDLVIVHAGGAENNGLLAYKTADGAPAWRVACGDHTYSSPQAFTIAGQRVVLILTNTGLTAVDPSAGTVAWDYPWKIENYRAIQPLAIGDQDVLLGTGIGHGTRRIQVSLKDGKPQFNEKWTTLDIKPNYNDFVAVGDHLYGFDVAIFCCVNLETGTKRWKNGRYGAGQVLGLPDADQLLVLSESGDAVLLEANPKSLKQLAKVSVLEGKTWNHPILVGDRLYVRNSDQMACWQLPLAEGASPTSPAGEAASTATDSSGKPAEVPAESTSATAAESPAVDPAAPAEGSPAAAQ